MPRPIRRAALLLAAGGLALYAQDIGMVRRTAVAYTTQKNTLPLSEGARAEADRLAREAGQESRAGRFGDALRLYYQGMALMRNLPWTPAAEFASSLKTEVDHVLLEPGGRVTVTIEPLYTSERTALLKLTGSVWLVTPGRDRSPQRLGGEQTVEPDKLPLRVSVTLPADADGACTLDLRLAAPAGAAAPTARTAFNKAVPIHVGVLRAEVRRLREKVGSADNAFLDLYERIDRGEVSPLRVDLRAELARANDLLEHPGILPRGDLRRVFRSTADRTLQPYRLFVPDCYDAAKPAPLVLALHGMGGDENSMLTAYNDGQLKREAQRTGMLVACPKGRDSASMYRDAAEQDVVDVIADVRKTYAVDGARVYLMGHSMGGYGTWSVAMSHPDLFAGLGPIAGGGNPSGVAKIARIPMYVVHGDNDRTVAVTQSRVMVEAAKQAGANVVYVEVKGGGHGDVVAPQLGPMLDFFARQKR